jgi:HEAT repeat protein
MKEYPVELVSRMTAPEERCSNSADSISWHAHREAETLSDSSMVDELADYVAYEEDKKRRQAAYFILGKLGQRVRNLDCASILIARLDQEENKYVLSSLLCALGGVSKPQNVDLKPVFRRLHDDRWLVRHSAIEALKRTDSVEAEDQLLELLNATSDPSNMVYCHATLNEIGSAKSIPHLQKNLSSRKPDVKLSVRLAIEAIESRAKSCLPG